jgi:hypothetical protein
MLFSCDDLSVIRRELWFGQTLPAAGFLMLVNHRWWTFAPVIGVAAYVDTGGREYSYKVPSFAQLPGCDWAKETRRPGGLAG